MGPTVSIDRRALLTGMGATALIAAQEHLQASEISPLGGEAPSEKDTQMNVMNRRSHFTATSSEEAWQKAADLSKALSHVLNDVEEGAWDALVRPSASTENPVWFRKRVGSHPDAEIFRLEKEMKAAIRRYRRAEKPYDDAEAKYFAIKPAKPEEIPAPDNWLETRGRLSLIDFQEGKHPLLLEDKKRYDENEARLKAWQDECHRLKSECRVNELEKEYNRLVEDAVELGMKMLRTPAHTIDGIRAKLRADKKLYLDAEAVRKAIAADLKRVG